MTDPLKNPDNKNTDTKNTDTTGVQPENKKDASPEDTTPDATETSAPRIHPLLDDTKPPANDDTPRGLGMPVAARTPLSARTPAAPLKSYGRTALSIAFNIAAGGALTAAAKAAVVATMTWAAAPAIATLVLSSFAVGAASASFQYAKRAHKAKKDGLEVPAFLSKQTAKSFMISSGFALIGGALFLGFEHQIKSVIGSAVHWLFPADHAQAATVAVVPVAVPAPVVCLSALDHAHDVIAHTSGISHQVQDALARSASANAHVAAQGTKDLAYYSYNGFGGMPKDATLAAELFEKAAAGGNVQAKIDLLYLQHHGLGGITANPAASATQMTQIHTPRASHFAKAWHAVAPKGKIPTFDARAIVSSIKGICLK